MTIYREKLWPTPWLYVSTALVLPAALLVFLPINVFVGIGAGIVLYGACVVILLATTPTIEVTNDLFVAGKARLPVSIVGATEAFTGDEARAERGPRLDSRSWLLIRGWVSPIVKIEVLDVKDPVPYWLVSTRHPEALVSALESAKTAVAG